MSPVVSFQNKPWEIRHLLEDELLQVYPFFFSGNSSCRFLEPSCVRRGGNKSLRLMSQQVNKPLIHYRSINWGVRVRVGDWWNCARSWLILTWDVEIVPSCGWLVGFWNTWNFFPLQWNFVTFVSKSNNETKFHCQLQGTGRINRLATSGLAGEQTKHVPKCFLVPVNFNLWNYLLDFSTWYLHYNWHYFFCLFIFSNNPPIASNNHGFAKTSSPTGTLLFHHNVKCKVALNGYE